VGSCDFTVEQLASASTHGTEFVFIPSAGRISVGDQLKALATNETVIFTYDPPVTGAPTQLNVGEFFEFSVTEPVHIQTDGQVQIARFSISSTAGSPGQPGDSFQAEVAPVGKFTNRHTFSIDNYGVGGSPTQRLDVVTTSVNCVFLDGGRVPPSAFVPVGTGAFLAASLEIEPGQHVLESDPVSGVTVYGFADWEGNGTIVIGRAASVDCGLFLDGFESGDTDAWSSVTP